MNLEFNFKILSFQIQASPEVEVNGYQSFNKPFVMLPGLEHNLN